MQSLLFILASNSTGGIVSSFKALYEQIKADYDIKLLFIESHKNVNFEYPEILIKNKFLDIYFTPYSSLSPWEKFLSLFIKPYRRFCAKRGIIMTNSTARLIVKHIQHKNTFNVVIGFSEGTPTFFVSLMKGVRKLSWIHCDFRRYYASLRNKTAEIDTYSRMDGIVNVSQYTQRCFLEVFPQFSKKTRVINNILDYVRIGIMSKLTVEDNRFNHKRFNIISVGRIDPVKRFAMVPYIAQKLKENGLVFSWYIIGPSAYDGAELQTLKNNINKYGVEQEVQWLGAKSNPYSYMLHSDLYVCLSSSEACPMVFNESRCLGLPVVSTTFGSVREFVHDGVDGIISPIDDIWQSISIMMTNRDLYTSIKSNCNKYPLNNDTILRDLKLLFD